MPSTAVPRPFYHDAKPPPAHRARCPYAQRLCSLALLICSPAQADLRGGSGATRSTAQGQLHFACGLVSSRGPWWRWTWSPFQRSRRWFCCSVLRLSCSHRIGWGSGVDAYAGPAHSQCTYVQFGVKIIFIDPWDMVGTLAVVLGTHDKDLENLAWQDSGTR